MLLLIIIIMSLMPISSSDQDIGGVPSMQSSYSARMKRCGICLKERRVLCKCEGQIREDILQAIDNYGGRDLCYKKVLSKPQKAGNEERIC